LKDNGSNNEANLLGSTRDYLRSIVTDAALPVSRQLLEDVVMETLTDRQVPNRTDYKELRDTVNQMRGQASNAASGTRKVEKRMAKLEAQITALLEERTLLVERIKTLEKRG
jgi:septal ring factor EnvC (AmiA/AmiB activator)